MQKHFFYVVCALTAGKYGPETVVGASLPKRKDCFDKVYAQDAVWCSRKMMRAMDSNTEPKSVPVAVADLHEVPGTGIQSIQVDEDPPAVDHVEADVNTATDDSATEEET